MRLERSGVTAIVVGVLVAIPLIWLCVRYTISTNMKVASIGDVAPDIGATAITGRQFDLQSLRGRPVLLNFFTPWCQPCIDETPDLITFAKKYSNQVQVVMIDRGDDETLVQNYVQQYHVPSNVIVLLNPNDSWSKPYGVTGQPETFFISSNGKIEKHLIGPLTESQMAGIKSQ